MERLTELKKEKAEIGKKLHIKISLNGRQAIIEGDSVDEYTATQVLEALSFGFSAKKALLLVEPDMLLRKIHIRDYTRRKNLKDVRARIIGTEGKTKRTIESISDCEIVINGNEVGIIGLVDNIESATIGLKNIVKGSKQANVYNFMERMNTEKKKYKNEDLGLRDKDDNED